VSRLIREARVADAAGLAALLTELGYPASPQESVELLDQVADDPRTQVHIAESEGQVVGLIATHLVPRLDHDRLSCRVIDIVVAREHRRSGIGTLLMATAEDHARRSGARRIDLSSGDWRPESHAFYTRLDFTSEARSFTKRLP
jgi:GNAT superfamily N-acetyltransferase